MKKQLVTLLFTFIFCLTAVAPGFAANVNIPAADKIKAMEANEQKMFNLINIMLNKYIKILTKHKKNKIIKDTLLSFKRLASLASIL